MARVRGSPHLRRRSEASPETAGVTELLSYATYRRTPYIRKGFLYTDKERARREAGR